MSNEETTKGKRKGGGAKLFRSETVTVRFDPKLRYLAELAARIQRRTVSSFVEWAVEESLKRITVGRQWIADEDDHEAGRFEPVFLAHAATSLWDVDEADRFAKLAISYPGLLTHDEQILWKLVCENGYFWEIHENNVYGGDAVHRRPGIFYEYSNGASWTWNPSNIDNLCLDRLRKYWKQLCAVVHGEEDRSVLPALQNNPYCISV